MNKTEVKITLVDPQGAPYQGGLVRARLDKPFFYQGIYVNNNEYREFTNSYGNVELLLVPSTYDTGGENFYYIDIVYDTVTTRKVIVPESATVLTLGDLEEYKLPYERVDFLGDCDSRL